LKKLLGSLWFTLTGWKLEAKPDVLAQARHSVMVAAPHTSNWDFPYAIFSFWYMGLPLRYFIKDDYTKSILGWFFTWTGALGVDRTKRNNLVEHTVDLLKKDPNLVILVPAEGTRKRVDKWRKGFYIIAQQAGVPISLGFLDYKNKIAGVGKVFIPTGNFEEDMEEIQQFYIDKTGKHPDLYNPKIY
jgi:1-acyl-sn-glycerol-3-phosphate acyltransferase